MQVFVLFAITLFSDALRQWWDQDSKGKTKTKTKALGIKTKTKTNALGIKTKTDTVAYLRHQDYTRQ